MVFTEKIDYEVAAEESTEYYEDIFSEHDSSDIYSEISVENDDDHELTLAEASFMVGYNDQKELFQQENTDELKFRK